MESISANAASSSTTSTRLRAPGLLVVSDTWYPFGHCDMDTDIGGGQTRDDLMTLRLCDVILCTLKTSFTTLTRSRSDQWASCEFRG
jgi:hypothetical protein